MMNFFCSLKTFLILQNQKQILKSKKKNLLVFGQIIDESSNLKSNNTVYGFIKEMGYQMSWSIMAFSILNLIFLFMKYTFWAKAMFFIFSLVALLLPTVAFFGLKMMIMDLQYPSDFKTSEYELFIWALDILWKYFPNFSIQEIEFVIIQFALCCTVALMLTLPIVYNNYVKDLIETHRAVNKFMLLQAGEDAITPYRKVIVFMDRYMKKSKWAGYIKLFKIIVFIFFAVVLPMFLKN